MGVSLNPSSLLSGEGLDVSSLVTQLMNQKSGQLTEWQNEQTTLQQQAGLLKSINDDLTKLADAVTTLSDPLGALTAQAATSTNSTIVTATAQANAVPGSHSIVVSNLATAGLVYTDPLAGGADASILPSGETTADLTLLIGGSGGQTADIQVTAGSNDTLATLAKSINRLSVQNNWGITASAVTDADGARLSIVSQATGQPGALEITNNSTSLKFGAPMGGTNAAVTIDGTPYHYTTNSFTTEAMPGVTLNLASASPTTTVQVTVGSDTQRVTAAINNFVSAYNQVISDINQQYTVNPATDSQGPLAPDSALRALQSSLMQDVTYSISGNSGFVNLAALGINMNDDGTLTVGTTPGGKTMSQVLSSNPTAFQEFFQNAAGTGFATKFHSDLMNLTSPTTGLLNMDLAQNKTMQQNVADNISNFKMQLTAQQAQLTKQFSLVNASLQSYPLLLQQVTETLATMNTSSNSSGNGSGHPVKTSGF